MSGTIALPLSAWHGRPVRDLVLRLERGRIVEIRAAEGREAVVAELTAGGEGARSCRELALGLNPLPAIPTQDLRRVRRPERRPKAAARRAFRPALTLLTRTAPVRCSQPGPA